MDLGPAKRIFYNDVEKKKRNEPEPSEPQALDETHVLLPNVGGLEKDHRAKAASGLLVPLAVPGILTTT